MENFFIHPDAMKALNDQVIKPLLNGDETKSQKIIDSLVPGCIADMAAPFDDAVLQPLADKIMRLQHLPAAFQKYYSNFASSQTGELPQHRQEIINCMADWKNKNMRFGKDKKLEAAYKEIFKILWPHTVKGAARVRVGGERDGGYVFMDPGRDGLAYSFGVSSRSPWDLEMAQKGYRVYQFDGTIKNAPDKHPNLRFIPKNIVASENPKPHERNIRQIFSELGHDNQKDIILQIDIEGGEWEFFENIETSGLLKFSQIIGEFHKMLDPAALPRAKAVFEKICETHVPVHFHYNNWGPMMVFPDFLVSPLFEVSFVRRDLGEFEKSAEVYPGPLDRRNVLKNPEIYIGSFQDIAS